MHSKQNWNWSFCGEFLSIEQWAENVRNTAQRCHWNNKRKENNTDNDWERMKVTTEFLLLCLVPCDFRLSQKKVAIFYFKLRKATLPDIFTNEPIISLKRPFIYLFLWAQWSAANESDLLSSPQQQSLVQELYECITILLNRTTGGGMRPCVLPYVFALGCSLTLLRPSGAPTYCNFLSTLLTSNMYGKRTDVQLSIS